MEDNENQLLKELALDEKDLKLTSLVGQRDELVDEEETAQDQDAREEIEEYDNFMKKMRVNLIKTSQLPEKTPFDFSKVTTDITDFKNNLLAEESERLRN